MSADPGTHKARHSSAVVQAGFTVAHNVLVFDKKLSALALRLYLQLKHYAWLELDPEQAEIAENLGIGPRAVRAHLRELQDHGLVRSVRRGRGMTNAYVIDEPADPDRHEKSVLERHEKSALTGTKDPISPSMETRKTDEANASSPQTRKRDPVWDVLAELYGDPAPHEKTRRGKIVRDLRAAMGELPDDEQAAEIRRRAGAYRRAWPEVAFTETALHSRWTTLGQMIAAGEGRSDRDPAEKAKDWIARVGWQIVDEDDVVQMLRDFGLAEDRIPGALAFRATINDERTRERETLERLGGRAA